MPLPTSSELREMLEEATPGPWRAVEASICERCAHVRASATLVCSADMADASLIALAPQLAEEVIRLREEIAGIKRFCRDGMKVSEAEARLTDHEREKGWREGRWAAYYDVFHELDKVLHKEQQ